MHSIAQHKAWPKQQSVCSSELQQRCRGEAGTHRGQGHVLLEGLGHRGGSLRGVTGEHLYLIHYHTCTSHRTPEHLALWRHQALPTLGRSSCVQARQAPLSATFHACLQLRPETHASATSCLHHCRAAVFELGQHLLSKHAPLTTKAQNKQGMCSAVSRTGVLAVRGGNAGTLPSFPPSTARCADSKHHPPYPMPNSTLGPLLPVPVHMQTLSQPLSC